MASVRICWIVYRQKASSNGKLKECIEKGLIYDKSAIPTKTRGRSIAWIGWISLELCYRVGTRAWRPSCPFAPVLESIRHKMPTCKIIDNCCSPFRNFHSYQGIRSQDCYRRVKKYCGGTIVVGVKIHPPYSVRWCGFCGFCGLCRLW